MPHLAGIYVDNPIESVAEPVMHGNIATAWEETDSDECPQCKAVRLEWHEIMDDTETIRMRSDGGEVSETTEKPKFTVC
jgi:hypothetical protein